MKISNIQVYGLEPALENSGLPYEKGQPKANTLIKLANSKSRSHSKFLRQIMIGFNITASGYFMKEFDTYKIGVTRMSTSTMHTLLNKKLTLDDFEINTSSAQTNEVAKVILSYVISKISKIQEIDDNSNSKLLVIKSILPESFNYTSYIMMNYEVLRTMYKDRINHRLPEWQEFLNSFKDIPFFEEFIKGE